MSASPHPRLTEEEYLKIERAAEFKSEFYDGIMYPMGGPSAISVGSYSHGQIVVNLGSELRAALRTASGTITTDVRVRAFQRGSYAYPDVMVVCGAPAFADDQMETLLNPSLIVEVFSPCTEANDRGIKFVRYRQIASLQEYGLVSQTEPRVEIFRRQPSGDWLMSESVGLDATCRFDSVGCQVALAEIYHQVSFSEDRPA